MCLSCCTRCACNVTPALSFFFFFPCVHKSMWAQPTVFLQSQNLHFFSFILAIGFVFFFFSRRCAELPLLLQFVLMEWLWVSRRTESAMKIEEGLFPFYIDTFDIHEYTCLQDYPQECTPFLLFTNLQDFLLLFFFFFFFLAEVYTEVSFLLVF